MSDLLKSKRTWVLLLTALFHILAQHHVLSSSPDVDAIADQVVLAIGAAGVIVTKVMDSRKAAQAPQANPAEPPKQ